MAETANNAQVYLLENGLGDRVLNDNKHKANTPENAKHWVYASDAMMGFLESERRKEADLESAALPIQNVSQRSELLKAEDKDRSFDEYADKYYRKPKVELVYRDKRNYKPITEKELIAQYKRAHRL